jgi:hypothetical protein
MLNVPLVFGKQSKYRLLTCKIELWNPEQIWNMVIGCIVMHNMMVRYCQSLGTEEDAIHYAINDVSAKQLSVKIKTDSETKEVLASLGLTEVPALGEEGGGNPKTEVELQMEKMLMEKCVAVLNDTGD